MKVSVRYSKLLLYSDGRIFCKIKNQFLNPLTSPSSEFPYFNITGHREKTKRVICKNLIAETFILGRPIRKSEIVAYKNNNIFDFSVDNLIIESRHKNIKRRKPPKKEPIETDLFYDWNEAAIYC